MVTKVTEYTKLLYKEMSIKLNGIMVLYFTFLDWDQLKLHYVLVYYTKTHMIHTTWVGLYWGLFSTYENVSEEVTPPLIL